MKSSYFLAFGLLCSLSCSKDNATPRLDAAFNQKVTLRHQQSASLPSKNTPELSVTITDVIDNRCPETSRCQNPGKVHLQLSIADQQGVSQALALTFFGSQPDSAVVAANGRSYKIVAHTVTPLPTERVNRKEDKLVTLTVRR